MEKKEYVKPNVEILLLESECTILAGSDSLGTETDSGDNAAKRQKFDDFSNSLLEDDEF